jgi:hypothetical protein
MSITRVVPIVSISVLALIVVLLGLMGRKNETFDGVIVQDVTIYEFYPRAKDCNYQGSPYLLLPNHNFQDIVTSTASISDLNGLFHGVWRAKLNGNLSGIGWYKYRKSYWRELSVNFVTDAVKIDCGAGR